VRHGDQSADLLREAVKRLASALLALSCTLTPLSAAAEPVDLLTFHEPNYIISGFTEETQVKFQFSIKYDLWPNRTAHAVYFFYTQRAFWDLWSFDASSPFTENNYNPGLFWAWYADDSRRANAGCGFVALNTGLDHESNGESSTRSRAWNRVFSSASFACVGRRHAFVTWSPELWLPFGLAENSDIVNYVGYGQLSLRVGAPESRRWYGSVELGVTGRRGTGSHGSVLVDFAWKPGYRDLTDKWRFTPYLYAQYFRGYAESLLSYDRDESSFRAGFGFRDTARISN
jgi:phospholipase A1